MFVPFIYVMMGACIGALTGLTFALTNAPGGIMSAFNSAVQNDEPLTEAATKPADYSTHAQGATAGEILQVSYTPQSIANKSDRYLKDGRDLRTTPAATGRISPPETQRPSVRVPATYDKEEPSGTPAKRHPARSVFHPFTNPYQTLRADVTANPAVTTNDAKLPRTEEQSTETESKPAHFYVEGDFTVADYDSSDGTVVASDGRTFSIDSAVLVTQSSSWEDYHQNVHYRCGENGTCILIHAGTVTQDVHLI